MLLPFRPVVAWQPAHFPRTISQHEEGWEERKAENLYSRNVFIPFSFSLPLLAHGPKTFRFTTFPPCASGVLCRDWKARFAFVLAQILSSLPRSVWWYDSEVGWWVRDEKRMDGMGKGGRVVLGFIFPIFLARRCIF